MNVLKKDRPNSQKLRKRWDLVGHSIGRGSVVGQEYDTRVERRNSVSRPRRAGWLSIDRWSENLHGDLELRTQRYPALDRKRYNRCVPRTELLPLGSGTAFRPLVGNDFTRVPENRNRL